MILHCLLFLLLLFPWVTRIEFYSGLVPLCVLSFGLQGIPVHSVGAADIQIYYVNICKYNISSFATPVFRQDAPVHRSRVFLWSPQSVLQATALAASVVLKNHGTTSAVGPIHSASKHGQHCMHISVLLCMPVHIILYLYLYPYLFIYLHITIIIYIYINIYIIYISYTHIVIYWPWIRCSLATWPAAAASAPTRFSREVS